MEKNMCEHKICKWVKYASEWHLICDDCIETQRIATNPKEIEALESR